MRAPRRAAVMLGALAVFGLAGAGVATAAEPAATPATPAPSVGLPDPTSIVPVVEGVVVSLLQPIGIV